MHQQRPLGTRHDPDVRLGPVGVAGPLRSTVHVAPAKTAPSKARQVDALFAKWNGPTSPGASVAVLQNGKIIYSHGYGMASLEYGVPNAPTTVFHMGSVSKQFTALAILLLAQDRKLSSG